MSFAWRPKSIEPEQSAQQINLTARQLKKVALKLGYQVKEGKKHLLVFSDTGLVTTVPRGRIKPGTLSAIVKQLGISKEELDRLL